MKSLFTKNYFLTIRYWLEIIALPAFIFLVIHLSGHGLMLLIDPGHDHSSHGHGAHVEEVSEHEIHNEEHYEDEEGHNDHDEHPEEESGHHGEEHGGDFLDSIFTVEVLSGLLLFILFTWLWHRPQLRKWVPCSHDHCHDEVKLSHLLAIVALCLHFFPEAAIRHELLHGLAEGQIDSLLGFVGFTAHFFVDVIVALVISGYWKSKQGRVLSFASIVVSWLLAFFFADSFIAYIPESFEGVLFVVSAFLLAMFVHKPHKPQVCTKCD